jgi:hypothetical protein
MTIEELEMNVDDFYGFAIRCTILQNGFERRIVFHSVTGDIYIAENAPGVFYWLEPGYVPMFEDGKYLGVGRVDGNVDGVIHLWDTVGLTSFPEPEPKLDQMGIVARIKITGRPNRWRHTT